MNSRTYVWDLPVRLFHWALAASFAGAYVLSESERLRNVHVLLGYTALGLLAFRLLWGFVGSTEARFRSFLYSPWAALAYLRDAVSGRARHYAGHNPAGSWAIYAILVLGIATGVSGYLQFNGIGGERFEEVHEVMANAWLVVVVAHLAGVVFSSIAHRENLVRAMVTGYKRGSGTAGPSRASQLVGVGLAAALMGFWGWSLSSGGGVPGAGNADAAGEGQFALREGGDRDDD